MISTRQKFTIDTQKTQREIPKHTTTVHHQIIWKRPREEIGTTK